MSAGNPLQAGLPPRRLKVLLLGYGHLGISLLRGLLASETVEVTGVFRWSGRPASRQYWDEVEQAFAQLARDNGLPEIVCPGVNSYDFMKLVRETRPDVLLIGSWGEILREHILSVPDLLVINCHPSLLPRHRGANPYASVIMAGDTETGVSFHQVVRRIDAGPLLMQQAVPVPENITGGQLRDICSDVAEGMVPALMRMVAEHVASGQPMSGLVQDESQQSYYPQLKIEDGLIDWGLPPEALDRRLRALSPWVLAHSFLEGRLLVVFESVQWSPAETPARADILPGTILSQQGGVLLVATTDPGMRARMDCYRIGLSGGYLPIWLSRWVGRFAFKAGKRFRTPVFAAAAT